MVLQEKLSSPVEHTSPIGQQCRCFIGQKKVLYSGPIE